MPLLLALIYFLLPVPLSMAMMKILPPDSSLATYDIFWPVFWLQERVPAYRTLLLAEVRWMS